jgi:hypothetical protein
MLEGEVLTEARTGAAERAASDARRVLRQLRLPLEREAAALRDPAKAATLEAELASARERLAQLRGPGSRWSQRLNDGFTELAAAADYRFRAAMRTSLRRTEEEIDASDPANRWDATSVALQAAIATAVGEVSDELVGGAREIRAALAALLRDDDPSGDAEDRAAGLEVGELWSGKAVTGTGFEARVGMGFGALRGAQSGVLLLGMLGNLFSVALMGPILLGGAAIFAGKSVIDERKRLLLQRRQEARAAVRQYVDDVQFEVGTRMRDLLRELQREIRDETAARLEELQRTHSQAAARLEAAVKQESAARAQQLASVEARLELIASLERRMAAQP